MRRAFAGFLLAAAALTVGCSSTDASAPLTVTVNSTVVPTTVRVSAPPTLSSSLSSAASRSTSSASSRTTASPRSSSTVSRPSTTSPSSSSKSAASTLVQANGDLNAAGPDNGPACKVDKQYSDEPPTGLRPDVKAAWVSVKKQAATKGVTLCLNDGKRSKAQQIALYNLYVKQYGKATANDLVLPWQKSAHVKGYAVDVQPAKAYQWLQATKGKLGFCRIYDNETWHFEYSTYYKTHGCPARLPKP